MIDFKIAQNILRYIGTDMLVVTNLKESGFKTLKSVEFSKSGVSFNFVDCESRVFKEWSDLQDFKPQLKQKQDEYVVIDNKKVSLQVGDVLRFEPIKGGNNIRKRVYRVSPLYAYLDDGSSVRRVGVLEAPEYNITRLRKI